jgi:hypothetical protein
MGERRNTHKIVVGSYKTKETLGDFGVHGRIIIKLILKMMPCPD